MTDYDLARRPDGYGSGHGLGGYSGTGPHHNSEAAHLARFAEAIGLLNDDDHETPLASGLKPPASRPLWLCPACAWSPSDDGLAKSPSRCPKCGGMTLERTGAAPLLDAEEAAEAMRAEAAALPNRSTARTPGRRLTATERDVMFHLLQTTDLTHAAIARRLGCCHQTVAYHRQRAGILNFRVRRRKTVPGRHLAKRLPRPGIGPEITARALRLCRATLLTDAEIAQRLGCSATVVHRRRVAAGIPCARARGRKNRKRGTPPARVGTTKKGVRYDARRL